MATGQLGLIEKEYLEGRHEFIYGGPGTLEDVLVDTRGNIYIPNKQWGIFVLRYTGQDEPAPTAR